jgi:DNA-binding GntR family transcriptional regulator
LASWPIQPADEESGLVTDWIFRQLWRRLVTQELAPGARITEDGLCEMLSVSRTPLREALRRLRETGMVVRQRNRTWRVAPMAVEEAKQLTLIRERLDGLVARLACERVRDERLSMRPAADILDQMETLVRGGASAAAILQLGRAFHAELEAAAAAPHLLRMLERLRLSLERYRYLLAHDMSRAPAIVEEHRVILAAVLSGDADAAEDAMRAHIAAARNAYLKEIGSLIAANGWDVPAPEDELPRKRKERTSAG